MQISREALNHIWHENQSLIDVASLAVIALSWFVVNTITVSLAISFWMQKRFWSVWQEGQSLYVMNFLGSAAAAGLIRLFYEGVGSSRVGSSVIFLSVPIAV